jgi:hypothetical protein
MSGLLSTSIDLAVSSKKEIARVLKSYLSLNRYTMSIGSSPGILAGDSGTATAGTIGTQIVCAGKTWTLNQWVNFRVEVSNGGAGVVTANSADTLIVTISPAPVATDTFIISMDVNPTLGNNFQLQWDSILGKVIIHNDFPIYSGSEYYWLEVIDPNIDKQLSVTVDLTDAATPYNHLFLVNGVAHIGQLNIVASADTQQPTPPAGTLLYIGWVWRGPNDEIVTHNIGRLIDTAFLINNVQYLDYLDEKSFAKVVDPALSTKTLASNILRFTTFYGPNITKTILEVGLFMKDEFGNTHMFAYSKVDLHNLLESENLRIIWKVVI